MTTPATVVQQPLFPTPAAAAFTGWHRGGKREPWRRLTSGPDYNSCWGRLLDSAGRLGGDLLVTRADAPPSPR